MKRVTKKYKKEFCWYEFQCRGGSSSSLQAKQGEQLSNVKQRSLPQHTSVGEVAVVNSARELHGFVKCQCTF
jgi:hypothetical protein